MRGGKYQMKDVGLPNLKPEREIFYMEFDAWGRSSRSCDGWGLCNFRACFLCCVDDNGYKIDCETKTEMVRTGWIYLTGQTGYFSIELDPSNPEEQAAIDDQSTLYVDYDIYTNDLKIHSGEYAYDSSLGGYNVDVTLQ